MISASKMTKTIPVGSRVMVHPGRFAMDFKRSRLKQIKKTIVKSGYLNGVIEYALFFTLCASDV